MSEGPSKDKEDNKPRIATLGTLGQQERSSDDEGQRFYVGGSSRSGQQVLGPSRREGEDPSDMISNIFKAAREHGAEVVEKSEEQKSQNKFVAFGGPGSTLVPNEYGEGSSASPQPSGRLTTPSPSPISIVLKMWNNGFSIDDGPLRSFNDPESKEFLSSIKRGEIPRELTRAARGKEVSLNIEDHHAEEYVAPKRDVVAFSGSGHRLGAVTPETISSPLQSTTNPSEIAENERLAAEKLKVDTSSPATNIQVRLADGTRLRIKLNLTHSIQDIRSYICDARPDHAPRPFILMTTFPNKPLSEEDLTIEQANLQNSTLVQKFI